MNRARDHGRGYTCASIRSTERRWRRRIGTRWTSIAAGSTARATTSAIRVRSQWHQPAVPARVGVGLTEVERFELPRLHELLALHAWLGQLDQRGRRRV